jgi:hypothetical protein
MPRRSSSCSRSIPVHENTYKCEGRTNPGKLPLIVIRNPGQFVPDKSHRASAISTTSLILGLRLQGRFLFRFGAYPGKWDWETRCPPRRQSPVSRRKGLGIGNYEIHRRRGCRASACSREVAIEQTTRRGRRRRRTRRRGGPVARKRIPLIMLISHFLTQDIVCVCKAKGALLFMRIHAYGTHARRVRPGRSPLAL